MNSILYFEGKKYISTRRAAEISGYSADYIGQLCRAKKLDCKMIERDWFVLESSLVDHQKSFSENWNKTSFNPNITSEVVSDISKDEKDKTDKNKDTSFSRDIQNNLNPSGGFTYSFDEKHLIPEIKKLKKESSEKIASICTSRECKNSVSTNLDTNHYSHKSESEKISPIQNDTEDIIFKNRRFRKALRTGTSLFVLSAIVLGIFFIKDNFQVKSIYKESTDLVKGLGQNTVAGLSEAKNYIDNINLSAKKNTADIFAKLSNFKLLGGIEESSFKNTLTNTADDISLKTYDIANEFFSSVKNYLTGFFGGENKFAEQKIMPIKTFFNQSSSSSAKIALTILSPNLSESSTDNLTSSAGKSQPTAYNLKPDITRREVLDLIKQFESDSKSLIYTTSAITGANSLITNQSLSDLKNRINSLEQKESFVPRQLDKVYNVISRSFDNITSLDSVTITNSSFSGTTGVFSGMLTVADETLSGGLTVGSNLTVSGISTSTFTGGISANRFNSTATSTLAGLVLASQGLTISTLDCSSSGQLLQTDASGNVICGTDDTGSGGSFAWTSTINYGALTNATNTPIWFQSGLQASSTSHFVYASTTMVTATTASSTNLIVSGNSTLGTVSSGIWNGASIGNSYVDDDITLTNLTQITNRAISDTTGTLTVARGGTGQTSFLQGWLHSDGTTFTSSTSPTVAYLTATSTTATSTFAWGLQANALNVTSQIATSTFANGIQLANGCFRMPDGNCLGTGGGSGTVTSIDMTVPAGLTISGNPITVSGTLALGVSMSPNTFVAVNGTGNGFVASTSPTVSYLISTTTNNSLFVGNLGIGTTSPYAKLSVSGDTALDSMFVNFASSSAPSLTLNYLKSATSTILNNTNYAWSIATSTTASPIFSISTLGSGYNVNATTTINGGFNLNNGALLYDYSSGITSINSFETGPMNFDDNAGIVSWVDLNITSASAVNTKHSYTAQIDSNPVLSVYGESDGVGTTKNLRVGIGTTTPLNKLTIHNATTTLDSDLGFTATSTGLTSWYNWTMGIDISDAGKFKIASSTALGTSDRLVVDGSGNFGVGTSSPWRTLSVAGTVSFNSSLGTGIGGNYLCIDTTTFEVLRGNGSACTASSIRFKENVNDINYGLAEVLRLRPVSYNYKQENNMGAGVKLGFIAEEMQTVLPEVVSLDKKGQVFGLDYPVLTSVLTKAIQELNLKISDLEAGIVTASSTISNEPSSSLFSWIINKFMTTLGISFGQDKIKAKEISGDKICVGDTCVTEDQFKTVFGSTIGTSVQAGGQSSASSQSSSSSVSSSLSLQAGNSQSASSESSSVSSEPEAESDAASAISSSSESGASSARSESSASSFSISSSVSSETASSSSEFSSSSEQSSASSSAEVSFSSEQSSSPSSL